MRPAVHGWIAALALALAACGGDDEPVPSGGDDVASDTGADAGDTGGDGGGEDAVDATTDAAPDATADVGPDADAAPDATVDVGPDADAAVDASPDADTGAEDAGGDAAVDAAPDSGADTSEPLEPYDTLSEWGFFVGPLVDQVPAPGVVPYTVNAPLWADFARKGRYIVLPEGERATMTAEGHWEFPPDTIIIKTFFFDVDRRDEGGDARIVETRLLIRTHDDDWDAWTYVWDEAQTEAVNRVAGSRLEIDYIDADGAEATQTYLVPNLNQCGNCHEVSDRFTTLGLTTAQLNLEMDAEGAPNQLAWLGEMGVIDFDGDPDTLARYVHPADETAPLEDRARAYLHGNCSHCHQPGGGGGRSGLVLLYEEEDPARYGVCKSPVAAGAGAGGRDYDIVPGFPSQSIIPFRMASVDPEIKMPELPNLIADEFGVELIEAWIAGMEPTGCD